MKALALMPALALALACSPPQQAAEAPVAEQATSPAPLTPESVSAVRVEMMRVSATGTGESVGVVMVRDTPDGAAFDVDLRGLPPGQHGFHMHENAACGPGPDAQGATIPAGAAGAHWDPTASGAHHGPEGEGHMGDLPRFDVGADGTARLTLMAPRLRSVAELRGRALMVHAGGDNYSDTPAPLGGGGARIACGVIG